MSSWQDAVDDDLRKEIRAWSGTRDDRWLPALAPDHKMNPTLAWIWVVAAVTVVKLLLQVAFSPSQQSQGWRCFFLVSQPIPMRQA